MKYKRGRPRQRVERADFTRQHYNINETYLHLGACLDANDVENARATSRVLTVLLTQLMRMYRRRAAQQAANVDFTGRRVAE